MRILIPIICIALTSCVSTKAVFDVMSAEKLKGKENSDSTFIIKTNGEKIMGISNKFRYPSITQKDYLINGIRVNIKDVAAYQDKDAYHSWYKAEKERNSHFVERLRTGKINLYYYSVGDMKSGFNWYYFFEKEPGKIEPIDYNKFEKAISDNANAMELLQQLFPKMKIKHDINGEAYDSNGNRARITRVVELYNKM